jgi:hypothetical protein
MEYFFLSSTYVAFVLPVFLAPFALLIFLLPDEAARTQLHGWQLLWVAPLVLYLSTTGTISWLAGEALWYLALGNRFSEKLLIRLCGEEGLAEMRKTATWLMKLAHRLTRHCS